MGFKDFYGMNLALLAKQAWRVLTQLDALWVGVLKSIYFPNEHFLVAKKRRGASWTWNSLLQGRDVIMKGGKWMVGDGRVIRVWKDKWLGDKILSDQQGENQNMLVCELINDANKKWDVQKVRTTFPPCLAMQVMQIPISYMGVSDRFLWPYTTDGNYSVKSGYHFIKSEFIKTISQPETSASQNNLIWKFIWKVLAPQKIKLFLWRICHNAIPVRDNLHKRRIVNSPMCPACNQERETIEHALLLCPWTLPVWFGSQLQLTPTAQNVDRVDSWLVQVLSAMTENKEFLNQRIGLLVTLLWEIWKTRNEFVFENKKPYPLVVLNRANVFVSEFLAADSNVEYNKAYSEKITEANRWRPPPFGKLKCNVDAAFNDNRKLGAVSAIIRDCYGRLITGKAFKIHTSSSLAAEALAIREGLILAKSCFCEDVLIESDCLRIIEACRKQCLIPEVATIIADIGRLKTSFVSCGLLWTRRDVNLAAHEVASLSLFGNLPNNWCLRFPPSLKKALSKDSRCPACVVLPQQLRSS